MADTSRSGPLYNTLWRWHFYAGLFTAPFLLILSVTGAIYLFNDELNDLIYPALRFAQSDAPALPPSHWIAAADAAWPGGTVTRVDMPTAPGRSAMLYVTPAEGAPLRAFIDPGTARVLGSFVYTRTLVGFADVFHGSLMLGDVGDAIVEIAACWGLILIATGLYLWWPRGNQQRWAPKLTLRGRKFWRDIHRFTGLYTALLIVFLILSGLPWASVWGGQVLQPVSNALGLGYPAHLRHHNDSSHQKTLVDTLGEAPWALEQAPLPHSGDHAPHHHSTGEDIGVDAAAALLATHGMDSAYRLSLPQDGNDVYSAYTYPAQPEGQHTIHLDRYSGEVLGDVRFADYGAIAKAVEWGVAIHMGNYFGRLNQMIMLFTCLAIIALVITGLIMWWRRRPHTGLGAPRALAPPRKRLLVGMTAGMLVLFPLAGASLAVVLVVEAALRRLRCRAQPTA